MWLPQRSLSLLLLVVVCPLILAGLDDYNWPYPIAPHILLVVPAADQPVEFFLPGYDLAGDTVSMVV